MNGLEETKGKNMSQEASGLNKWLDFVWRPGEVPITRARYQNAGILRLFVALPLTMVPTNYLIRSAGRAGWNLDGAQNILQAHFIATMIYCFSALALIIVASRDTPLRRKMWHGLNVVAICCEIVTVEAFLLGHGSLICYSVAFYPVIVALYRSLFDYFTAVLALVLCIGAFVLGGVAEVHEWVPLTPLMAGPSTHPLWNDQSQWANVLFSVPLTCVLTFWVVNYAVNQNARLHSYITRSVLQRYLPPALVDKAASGALSLDNPAQRSTLTVMFTDIVGFTALSEKLGPEALGDLLGQLLGEVADLSMKHGATVDKFIGDCVMVVFGAPEPMPPQEQATRCVNLALAIHERIKSVGGSHDLHARTGINTGEVVVGNFGSMARSDYTVLGPTVNVAARLESHSEPDCILIGPKTAEAVRDHFELEAAGPLNLKSVSHPVESFFVIGKKR